MKYNKKCMQNVVFPLVIGLLLVLYMTRSSMGYEIQSEPQVHPGSALLDKVNSLKPEDSMTCNYRAPLGTRNGPCCDCLDKK